jgi:hypothetical protein
MERQLSLRRVAEQRVEQRPRPLGIDLGDADDEPDAVLARRVGHPV